MNSSMLYKIKLKTHVDYKFKCSLDKKIKLYSCSLSLFAHMNAPAALVYFQQ